jgi:FtsZ-binding cell division protein ZapB
LRNLARTVDGLVTITSAQVPRLEEVEALRRKEQPLSQEVEALRQLDQLQSEHAGLTARHS